MGSIPTRSRQETGPELLRVSRSARKSWSRNLARLAISVALLPHAVLPAAAPAQETDRPAVAEDTVGAGAARPGTESQATEPIALQPPPADSTGPLPPVSPMGAFFRSLVLPGWGQVAADQPGRGAFYFAMEAGSLWMLFKTNAKLNAAKRSYPRNDDLIAAREAQFEDWAALAVFWALFSGVDAWVSAQLWDFKGEVVPPPDGSPGAAFQYSIPVGP